MKLRKISILLIAGLALTSCTNGSKNETANCLETEIGYKFCVTADLLAQLSTKEMRESDGDFQKEVFDYGAISASTIYYADLATKQEHILLSVFLFPAEKFDAAANPNEPPRFGQEVIRTDGKVLSVAGPHDSMFEPETLDGKNVIRLYDAMYLAASWHKF